MYRDSRRRPPVVERIGKLTITANHKERLKACAGQAVMATRSAISALRRFGDSQGAFGQVIDETHAAWDSRTDVYTCTHDAVVIKYFNPIVIFNSQQRRIFVIDPDWIVAATKSAHSQCVTVRRMD